MQAITARYRVAGFGGLALGEVPYPDAAENDVVVRVRGTSFTSDELDWLATWSDAPGAIGHPSFRCMRSPVLLPN